MKWVAFLEAGGQETASAGSGQAGRPTQATWAGGRARSPLRAGIASFPRITVVTPSFNQGQYLEATIRSVLDQGYPDLEYIVMDGGSADNSVEIIRKYEDRLAFWRSAKDGGQTEAIGQGFARATGEVMNWLNSDDLLAPGALRHIGELAQAHPEAGILAAATEDFLDGRLDGLRVKSVPSNLTVESLLFRNSKPIHRHQPGIYFRRSLYEAIGGFRENFHMCMDFDLHVRMLAHGAGVAYTDRTIAYFRKHAASKTQGRAVRNTLRAVCEYMAICDEVGARVGVKPNHRAGHLKTLLGAARWGLLNGKLKEAAEAMGLAVRLAICGR